MPRIWITLILISLPFRILSANCEPLFTQTKLDPVENTWGVFNLFGKELGASKVFEPEPDYHKKYNAEEAYLLVDNLVPRFSWGTMKSEFQKRVHLETISDIKTILFKVLNGSISKVVQLPRDWNFEATNKIRQQKTKLLLLRIDRLNKNNIDEEEMADIFDQFESIIFSPVTEFKDFWRDQRIIRQTRMLKDVEKGMPRSYLLFTLRDLGYAQIVALSVAGYFPVGFLSKIWTRPDGSWEAAKNYPLHDVQNTERQIVALKTAKEFFNDAGIRIAYNDLFVTDYIILKKILPIIFQWENAADRYLGLAVLYRMKHEAGFPINLIPIWDKELKNLTFAFSEIERMAFVSLSHHAVDKFLKIDFDRYRTFYGDEESYLGETSFMHKVDAEKRWKPIEDIFREIIKSMVEHRARN